MKTSIGIAAVGLALVLVASGAPARAQEVIRSVNSDTASQIMQGLGVKEVSVRPDTQSRAIDGTYDAVPISLGLVGCDDKNNCNQVGYTAYFGKQDLSLEWVVAYNKNHPVRMVFRGSGDAALYYDIFIAEGVTLDFVKASTKRFLDSIAQAQSYKLEQ